MHVVNCFANFVVIFSLIELSLLSNNLQIDFACKLGTFTLNCIIKWHLMKFEVINVLKPFMAFTPSL